MKEKKKDGKEIKIMRFHGGYISVRDRPFSSKAI
jgi:hypothetical protein